MIGPRAQSPSHLCRSDNAHTIAVCNRILTVRLRIFLNSSPLKLVFLLDVCPINLINMLDGLSV